MNCRVSQEELTYDRRQMEMEAMLESGAITFKCAECGDHKPLKEILFTLDWKDEGCCNGCAEDEEIRVEYE